VNSKVIKSIIITGGAGNNINNNINGPLKAINGNNPYVKVIIIKVIIIINIRIIIIG